MNNIKVKTQKTLSAILGLALAAIILLQAGNVQSKESSTTTISIEEASILADIERMFLEEEGIYFEEEIVIEELLSEVKVFNSQNELVAEGNIEDNEELRVLVNRADLLNINLGQKYFRIAD